MKQIIKLISFSFVVILVLFSSQTSQAEMYFGEFTPREEISHEMILLISDIDESLVALEIWLANDNFNSELNQAIGGERLKFRTKEQSYILTNAVTRISKTELYQTNFNQFSLPIIFTARPIDLPGEYKNKLMIRKIYAEELSLEEIIAEELIVKINPWVMIKKIDEQSKIIIEETDYYNKNLFSRSIPIIKIAANTDWKLYAVLAESEVNLTGLLKIIVPKGTSDYTSIKPEGITLNLEPKFIVAGEKTVEEEKNWVSIPCSLIIDDFTEVEAGIVDFPIDFYVSKLE